MITLRSNKKIEKIGTKYLLLFSVVFFVIVVIQPTYYSFVLIAYSLACFWLFFSLSNKQNIYSIKVQGKQMIICSGNEWKKEAKHFNLKDLQSRLSRVRGRFGEARYILNITYKQKYLCCISRQEGFEEHKIIALSTLLHST